MTPVIHHNPDCGTSRNVLAILRATGSEPHIVEYLQTGWSKAHLLTLLTGAGITARAALRLSGTPAKKLGLDDPAVADTVLIAAMLAHPILVNRPFVVTSKGIRLCRPSVKVLDLLDGLPPGPLTLEDGTPLIDAQGRRVWSH